MADIYRRGKTWWIRYTLKRKQVRESLCTTNKRVAQRKLDEYEEALKSESFQRTPKLFLETFLAAFYRYAEKAYPKKSVQNLRSCLKLFFDSAPVHRLDQVTKPMLTDHLQAQSAKRGWNPKTWNNHRSAFVTLFTYAIEYCDFRSPDPRHENPARGVPRVKKLKKTPIVFLNEDQIRSQLAALAPHPQMQAMVATLIFGGLRREELTWLTKDDVDLKAGKHGAIRIRSKEIDGEYWVAKTNSDRCVPILGGLVPYLRRYRPPRGQIWQFPSPLGGRWHPDAFSHALKKLQLKYRQGYKKGGKFLPWGCLEYRHTFATYLAMRGKSLEWIAKLMGNSVVICEKHYAAFRTQEMADDIETGIFAGPEGPRPPTPRVLPRPRERSQAEGEGRVLRLPRHA